MVHVNLTGAGVAGRTTEVRVTDGAAVVGATRYEWKTDGPSEIAVPWWPVADGPRALHIEAVPLDGETSVNDNALDVGVNVSAAKARVLVVDARASWASTFVRRALEDDPRFQVEHRVSLGPAVEAGTRIGRLDAATLDAAAVVIAGAPDGLSAGDVDLLDRFVRVRGGTLILLPDRAPSGPALQLFPGRWLEQLEASPIAVGPLRASEILRIAATSPVDVVLGAANGRPAIVMTAAGHGRVVVSGAMDGWRYRDQDDGTFDRFWRSVAAESAAESGVLRFRLDAAIAARGSRVGFQVYRRGMSGADDAAVSAIASCDDDTATSVRLWPAGPAGAFRGRLAIDGRERCRVVVSIAGRPSVAGGVAVTSGDISSVGETIARLERAARESGGAIARAGQEPQIAASLGAAAPTVERRDRHPMRSPWWMAPFAACLSLEWWLRRRAGLR